MSSMILCRGKEAKTPFVISGTGIRLRSSYELCYYIYNNIYLIGNDFISDTLLEFLRDEVGEEALAERLSFLKEKNAGLAEMIVTILKTIDYYSIGEIEEIREILNTLNNQNVYERLKSRGDSFLYNQCFYNAIQCYLRIINEYKGSELPGLLYAQVFHNLGVAYARMFLYEQAAEAFENAYRIGQHEESKNGLIAAKMMAKKDSEPESDDTTQEEYVVKREIETLMDNARYSDEYRQLKDLDDLKESGKVSEYNKIIDEFLDGWKRDYSKYSKRF